MTSKEIERLKELCKKATPGKWGYTGVPALARIRQNPVGCTGQLITDCSTSGLSVDENVHNATFIAAARTAIPALIAHIESQEFMESCANTPLMRDVMRERDEYKKALGLTEEGLKDENVMLIRVCYDKDANEYAVGTVIKGFTNRPDQYRITGKTLLEAINNWLDSGRKIENE